MNSYTHTLTLKQRHDEPDDQYWLRLAGLFDLDGPQMHADFKTLRDSGYPKADARDTVLLHYELLPYETFEKVYT